MEYQWEIWHRFEPAPSVQAAINAEHYWVSIGCWSCKKEAEIDLRRVKAEDGMTLTDVQAKVRCKRCRTKGKVLRPRA